MSCVAVQRRVYLRHRPERTVLHAVVREHLGTFLRYAEEHYTRPLPKYVRRTFEHYLRCGLPEHGFLRLRCEDCGHDRVVAFSCKERGVCPSCAGRTMANTAAHLVDRVLPNVAIRQWVLSLPHELRAIAARQPTVVSAIDRILFREVERWMRRSVGPRDGRAGALTFVQRFGGSLNLHVHFHVLFLEGLFTANESGTPVFHAALAPTRADLLEVLARVRKLVVRWVEKRGLRPAADGADDETDALDACARAAVQTGLFDRIPSASTRAVPDTDEPSGLGRSSVSLEGFNLHAAVRVGADDDVSRERLVRYCARPPFALERLSVLPDGRLAYQIKQPRKNATHRILTPIELLARIAALIPPPRHPFLRYHGVLAPSSGWRSAIVPRDPIDGPATAAPAAATAVAQPVTRLSKPEVHRPHDQHASADSGAAAGDLGTPHPTPTRPRQGAAQAVAPTAGTAPGSQESTRKHARNHARPTFAVLSEKHRSRLDHGKLLARTPRLDWSRLLRRTFAADVLVCPQCRGPARVIAAIETPAEAARFLRSIAELSSPATFDVRDEDDDDSQLPPPSSRPTSLPLPDD